jgi:iron only hydrogenase large subunit-like protein
MEAAVRSAHFLITGKEMENLDIKDLRGFTGCKELTAEIGGLAVGAAVVSGLGNARKLLDEVRAGRKDLHFIEVMTCPGGCINGGGQPFALDTDNARSRMRKLYRIDANESVRVSHQNQCVQRLYTEFLGKPLGEKSHHLLHTHYNHRQVDL